MEGVPGGASNHAPPASGPRRRMSHRSRRACGTAGAVVEEVDREPCPVDPPGAACALPGSRQRRAEAAPAARGAAAADPAAGPGHAAHRRGRAARRSGPGPPGPPGCPPGPHAAGRGRAGARDGRGDGIPTGGRPARQRAVRGGDRTALRVRRVRPLAVGTASWTVSPVDAPAGPLRLMPRSGLARRPTRPLTTARLGRITPPGSDGRVAIARRAGPTRTRRVAGRESLDPRREH